MIVRCPLCACEKVKVLHVIGRVTVCRCPACTILFIIQHGEPDPGHAAAKARATCRSLYL